MADRSECVHRPASHSLANVNSQSQETSSKTEGCNHYTPGKAVRENRILAKNLAYKYCCTHHVHSSLSFVNYGMGMHDFIPYIFGNQNRQ